MHLLCIAPLLLPLLPLASSCSSQKPLAQLREDYTGIVHTDLNNAKERIITLQGNTSCIENTQRVQNCTQRNNMDFVSILHNLTCHMWNMKCNHTRRLVTSVLSSLECACSLKLSEERQERRRTAMSKNQKQQRKLDREAQKLCKVAAILSSMTTCYEMLNSRLGNT